MTDEAQDGFVEDGPERAKGHKPGFWTFIWWWIWGRPRRSPDDDRKLWWHVTDEQDQLSKRLLERARPERNLAPRSGPFSSSES
ncbi:MAG: hypothetical protein H0U46_01480 [Actinobacteria bacterium]|nr:hypothetical protein [Actinomycetota bacterium]